MIIVYDKDSLFNSVVSCSLELFVSYVIAFLVFTYMHLYFYFLQLMLGLFVLLFIVSTQETTHYESNTVVRFVFASK